MSENLKAVVLAALADRAKLIERGEHDYPDFLIELSGILAEALRSDRKILICGNGGSAADAQHFAAEMVVRLTDKSTRRALPALALTTDTSTLTAAGNDLGFDRIFSRQIEALGQPGDVLIALSTSGNSPNLLRALETARQRGVSTVGLLGKDGGRARALCDRSLVIASADTARIQEEHIFLLHSLALLIEMSL